MRAGMDDDPETERAIARCFKVVDAAMAVTKRNGDDPPFFLFNLWIFSGRLLMELGWPADELVKEIEAHAAMAAAEAMERKVPGIAPGAEGNA